MVEASARALAGTNRYPDASGVALRTTIAQWHGLDSSLPLTLDNVAVGTGSSALIQQAVLACCRGGDGVDGSTPDEVIYPWRSFEAYPIFAMVAGAKAVEIPLDAELRNDLGAMAAAVTERTRLIIVCNPNNPTSTTVTRTELEIFLDSVPDHVHVLLDEAYFEYVRNEKSPDGLSLLDRYPNLAVARTFSKAFGLAGLRVGYLIGHPEFITAVNQVSIPFSVNSVAQAAAVASIEARRELLARTDDTVAQRTRILDRLPESLQGQAEANFVWLQLGDRAREFADALAERHVVVRCFDGDGVRITVTDEAETDALLTALDVVGIDDFARR
ncbi:aromatic amino acid aminotransferase [Corynebacterium terpenotabidum Y-11]|uniref:Aromatic amino acid aminotransferase n=1 Tax=Corynebacterium terpenotabidum Y-11 TaxID=1200352 RepID=S4XFA1_9CORY|nr:aromatic amino acid aminotransferase [Corynebacterium terpenotabidum Y-11]